VSLSRVGSRSVVLRRNKVESAHEEAVDDHERGPREVVRAAFDRDVVYLREIKQRERERTSGLTYLIHGITNSRMKEYNDHGEDDREEVQSGEDEREALCILGIVGAGRTVSCVAP
jgi:hypothetical protein